MTTRPAASRLASRFDSARAGRRLILGWATVGVLAWALLPWYFQQDRSLWQALPGVFGPADRASALVQVLKHGRPWLALGLVALVLAGLSAALPPGRRQGRWLITAAAGGLAGLLASGWAIGAQGWNQELWARLFGPLTSGQPGFGPGAFVCLVALVVLLGIGLARLGWFRADAFVAAAVLLCAAMLGLFVAFPVAKSIAGAWLDDAGRLSLSALAARVLGERVWGLGCLADGVRCGVAWNTLTLALMTASGTTLLGAMLALYAERGNRRWQRPLNLLALLPIITPPFVVGLGLILLFGRAGLVNQGLEWAFGVEPTRWFYGLFGVWLAQMFAFTPIAFLILRGVVQGIAPSLEEASRTLHASAMQTFLRVTLPLMKPGLANAFLVGFVESIADFGNPIVVGGQFSVLSTDIFFAIVGAQYDQGRAAALALLLTLFALAVFGLQQHVLGRGSYATVTGKGDAGLPMPLPTGLRRLCACLTLPWLAFTAALYLFALAGGFVQTWGRDYTPTLRHFGTAFGLTWSDFSVQWTGTAWNSLATTLKLAAIAAPLCAAMGLMIGWLLARTRFPGQRAFEFAALLSFAIPGTVLGVSYILAFNVPPFELTGTGTIIVLCFIFRSLPVGVRAGSAALRQIDPALDEASAMLRAGTATTLRRIVLPLLKPALVAALVYSFVRSMTTVSAVIFLVTAENELATTYIIGRVGNGDYGVALAYCTVLIALMSLATWLIQVTVGERRLGRRSAGSS